MHRAAIQGIPKCVLIPNDHGKTVVDTAKLVRQGTGVENHVMRVGMQGCEKLDKTSGIRAIGPAPDPTSVLN